jgi:hypothetical protein
MDTIEMLEAIGSNASLRHASTADLAEALSLAHASEALTAAVASGDASLLSKELDMRRMFMPQISQIFFSSK